MKPVIVYEQVPIINNGSSCPFCSSSSTETRKVRVRYYDSEHSSSIIRYPELKYCNRCDFIFGLEEELKPISHNNIIYRATQFRLNKRSGKKETTQRIFRKPQKQKTVERRPKKPQEKASVIPTWKENNEVKVIRNIEIVSTTKVNLKSTKCRLYQVNYSISHCLKCGGKLAPFTEAFPFSTTEAIKIPCQHCLSCDSTFVDTRYGIEALRGESDCLKQLMVDKGFVYPKYGEILKRARALTSSDLVLFLKKNQKEQFRAITIVTDRKEKNAQNDIYHYSDKIARQVLYAKVSGQREMQFESEIYSLLKCETLDPDAPSSFIVTSLEIRSGGGLYEKEKIAELIDVLLFSPVTKCFEVCHASLDSTDGSFFVDAKVFRAFICTYGNPGIPIKIYANGNADFFLRDESLLKIMGYSVSQSEGLSDSERQAVISDVLDTGLMTAHNVIALLEHNIRMHSAPKYDIARDKWYRDIKFVMSYKVNPSHFIISNIGIK